MSEINRKTINRKRINRVELSDEQKKKLEDMKKFLRSNSDNEDEYEIQKLAAFGYTVKALVDELFED